LRHCLRVITTIAIQFHELKGESRKNGIRNIFVYLVIT
jgi:hypothetical protein